MLILLTKSRDVKGWMKDIEKQPDRSQFKGDREKKHSPRTYKANWVGKVDKRTLYLTLEKSTYDPYLH